MTQSTVESPSSSKQHLGWIRKEYDDNGYVIVRNVLDANLVREMGDHVDWLLKKHPGVRPEHLGHTLIPDDPFWCRLLSDDRLLDIAQQFIGPNIALFASSYFSKPPYDGLAVLWHQDGSYWPLDPQDGVVSLWLAADDSTPENGCMRIIPGTQNMKFTEHVADTSTPNALSSKISAHMDESKAVDVILKAGDVSIHGPQLVHGSNANTSPKRRCGLTIRYIPTTTRILRGVRGWPDEKWPCKFLLRGKKVEGINEYAEMPKYDPSRHMPFKGCERWM